MDNIIVYYDVIASKIHSLIACDLQNLSELKSQLDSNQQNIECI